MLKRILTWFKGYLILHIKGKERERFLNLCIKNSIDMWSICDCENYKKVYVSRKAYKELIPFIKKTGVEIEVNNKKGFPYLFFRYKKRKLFLLGIVLFLVLIYAFSFFIWDINITGEDIYTDEQILRTLKEYNIELGTPKSKIDCAALEKRLRDDYENIAWISCELKGTRLNITINETIVPEAVKENEEPCNIVAVKDGIITDIYIESGTRVANKGDEVKKGDILITGAVNLYNDYDELIETSYVPANGEIYAIVSYSYNDCFDLTYYDKEYTGKEKKYYGLYFGNNSFEPYVPKIKYSNYDLVKTDKKLKLGSFFYLPVSFEKNCIKEYKPEFKTYTKEEAQSKARGKLNMYIDDLSKKGVEILENNVKIEISDNTCKAEGTIVTRELIGVPSEITIINQGEDTDGIY